MARVILTREDEERRHKWWEQQPVGSAIRAPELLGASRPGIGIVSRQPMLPQPPEIEPVGGETAPTTIPPAPAPTAPLDALDVRTRPGVVAGRPTQGRPPTAAEQVLRDHALPQPVATDHLGRPLPTFTMARDARGVPLPAVRQRAAQGIVARPTIATPQPNAAEQVLQQLALNQPVATDHLGRPLPTLTMARDASGKPLPPVRQRAGDAPDAAEPAAASPAIGPRQPQVWERDTADAMAERLMQPQVGVVPRPGRSTAWRQTPAAMQAQSATPTAEEDMATAPAGAGNMLLTEGRRPPQQATMSAEEQADLEFSIDELAAEQGLPPRGDARVKLPGGGIAFRDSDGEYRVAHGASDEVLKHYGLQSATIEGVPERTTMRQVQGLSGGQASVGLMDRPGMVGPPAPATPLILKTPQQERAEMEASRSEAMRRHAVPFIDRPSGQQAIDQAEADRTRNRRWGQSGSNTQWERRQREMQRREDDAAQIAAERKRKATSEREAREFDASEAQKKRASDERIAALNAAAKYSSDKREAGGKVTVEDSRKAIGDNLGFAQAYRQFLDKGYDLNNKKDKAQYQKDLAGLVKTWFPDSKSTEAVKLLGDALMEPLNDYYAALQQDGNGVVKPHETQGATPPPAKPKRDEGSDPAAKWRKTN